MTTPDPLANWTPAERETWDRIAACDHAAFWVGNPRDTEDTCVCGAIVRTVNTGESWGEHAAELRAEDRAYEMAEREAAREDKRW